MTPTANAAGPELAAEVHRLRWWHHIDLGSVTTPGRSNLRQQSWVERCLPADFSGQRVLDIGAWDGFFSFLAERRGASSVTALDAFQNPDEHADTPDAFALAQRSLGSRVQYVRGDILDYAPSGPPFDSVLFLGVYYHMKDPAAAFRKIRTLLRPGGRLYVEGLIRYGSSTELHRFRPEEIEPTTYCAATVAGMDRMCRDAGFVSARMRSRTDGMQTRTWSYRDPPGRVHWGLVSAYRSIRFPRSQPRAFFEVTG